MGEVEFWSLIDEARRSVAQTTDIPMWLISRLKLQPVGYIKEFKERFHDLSLRAYDARLWAAANLMLGLCSDDKFDDFRGWLIAQGKTVYERALESPDTLANLDHIDGEFGLPLLFGILVAPEKAYADKTGLELARVLPVMQKRVLRNASAWDGDEGRLKTLLPKLYAKYREPGSTR